MVLKVLIANDTPAFSYFFILVINLFPIFFFLYFLKCSIIIENKKVLNYFFNL